MSLLAVAQFVPGDDRDANLAAMRRLADDAVARGATLVVFPEYSSFFEPELGDASVAAAETLDGAFVQGVASMARELGIHVVAGMLESAGEKVSNTLVALDPAGGLIATYRKLHLYDAFGQRESDRVQAGAIEHHQNFAWNGLSVGVATSSEHRLPPA